MGLSRRLGGGGGGSRGASVECPRHISYTWSTQAYTIREILERFQLPCVVQCSGDPGTTTVHWEPSHFRFDVRQPLLLHAARTVRKLHARSLKASSQGQGRPADELLEEFGPPLAIPEDYDGWFYPIGRHNSNTATVHTLPRHTRVEGAAAASPQQFLVTTPLLAFTPLKSGSGSGSGITKFVMHEVSVGEVLTKVGFMKGEPTVGGTSGLATVPTTLISRTKQSLRCLDENRREVIIPFSHRALLYDVAENYCPPATPSKPGLRGLSIPGVVHTRTLVEVGNSFLPRIFKHVLGEPPALTDAFTGVLRCYSVFTEETVMAATMSRASLTRTALAAMTATSSTAALCSCLELGTESLAKFNIALNHCELKKTAQYCLALKTCEEHAPSFVRAIKVSFTLNPTVAAANTDDGSNERTQQLQAVAAKLQAEQDMMQAKGVQSNRAYECFDHEESEDQMYYDDSEIPRFERIGDDGNIADDEGVPRDETASDDIIHDEESVTTDDVDDSVLDITSMSDGAEIFDGVSDIVEVVDANSEFDISWGQLKRARCYDGSLSSVADSSTQSSCSISECSDSDSVQEGSVIGVGRHDSNISDSTVTRESTSTSVETVVLRASAPSPIYVNVQKKGLSVFGAAENIDITPTHNNNAEEIVTQNVDTANAKNAETAKDCGSDDCCNGQRCKHDAASSDIAIGKTSVECKLSEMSGHSSSRSQGDSSSKIPEVAQQNLPVHDTTVRSVWNITPTPEEVNQLSVHPSGQTKSDGHKLGGEESKSVWWGDIDDVERDSYTSESETDAEVSRHMVVKAEVHNVTDQMCVNSVHPARRSASVLSNHGDHLRFSKHRFLESESGGSLPTLMPRNVLSAQSSILSLSSSISSLSRHSALSACSSVQSEGGAQDEAIGRLERAFNEATHFLKSTPNAPTDCSRHSAAPPTDAALPPLLHPTAPPSHNTSQPQRPPRFVDRKQHGKKDPSRPEVQTMERSSKNGSEIQDSRFSERGKSSLPPVSTSFASSSISSPSISSPSISSPSISSPSISSPSISSPSISSDALYPSSIAPKTISKLTSSKGKTHQKDFFMGSTPGLSTQECVVRGAYHLTDRKINGKTNHQNGSKMYSAATQQNPHQSQAQHLDSFQHISSSQPLHKTSDPASPSADLDFVKNLGDKLMSVSRLNSLPKYQRLQPDSDVADSSYDSQQDITPRALSAMSSCPSYVDGDDSEGSLELEGERTPKFVNVDWDDRQDEQVV